MVEKLLLKFVLNSDGFFQISSTPDHIFVDQFKNFKYKNSEKNINIEMNMHMNNINIMNTKKKKN